LALAQETFEPPLVEPRSRHKPVPAFLAAVDRIVKPTVSVYI
jgi:hypothetical protein